MDVWFFTKTLPFLGVGSYFFFLLSLFACPAAVLSLLCRLAFGATLEPVRRSEKEAVAAVTPDLNDVRRSCQ